MPTFCRHNRFLERCPICSKTLPGSTPARRPNAAPRARAGAGAARAASQRAPQLRVLRETRASDDGYRSPLVPGLRSSHDALRLAAEVAFASARLEQLSARPPGLYAEARARARDDLEQATWACFLIAYLSPLQGEDPFAGIRAALAPGVCRLEDLAAIPLGPRSSHDPARGTRTLDAYCRWAQQAGSQSSALTGDVSWSPERRFARIFERLALPGFGRAGRYELLLILGTLGLYELRAASLALAGGRGASASDADLTALAAKRVFGIGDPLLLERRAAALAEAFAVELASLDLALWNWAAPQRATLGFAADLGGGEVLALACEALGVELEK